MKALRRPTVGITLSLLLLLLNGVGAGFLVLSAAAKPPREWLHLNTPQTPDMEISLSLIVNRVLNENLDVLQTGNRINLAKGNFTQSFAPLLPSIRPFLNIERFKGGEVISGGVPVNLDRLTYRPTVSGDYTIQTGGKNVFQLLASYQQLKRSRAGLDMTRQKTLLDACTSYFSWLKDIERERVSEVSVAEAKSQKHFRELRLDAGLGTRLEVLQTETLVKSRQNLLLSAANDKDSTALGLLNALNLPLDMPIRPEMQTTLTPMAFWRDNPNQDINALYQVAATHRPEFRALQTQVKEAKLQLGAAYADFFPTVTLTGYKRGIGQKLDDLRKTSDAAVTFSFDLLKNMGVNTLGNVQSAKARIQDAALNNARQMQEIQKNIAQALLDYRLYHDQLALEQQKCQEAEEAYRIAKARFDAGMAINLDVIEAEATLTGSRLSLQNAIMQYNIAQLKLLYETGQLTPDAILTAQASSLPPLTSFTPLPGDPVATLAVQAPTSPSTTNLTPPATGLRLSKTPLSGEQKPPEPQEPDNLLAPVNLTDP